MPERATVLNRSEKSAEAIVAASQERRAEREGESVSMLLGGARHQKPGRSGRTAGGRGEAKPKAARDEARLAQQGQDGSGPGLLERALAREN
ncbi:hypothetical protein ACUHMQ_06980, partial [Chitinimonas sp. PSY-7]|uniref:hypothetical protein n=1 Tax=Chitinimonas sp. PSY-7 TaxID=3459088 RepID=UPI00403FCFEC